MCCTPRYPILSTQTLNSHPSRPDSIYTNFFFHPSKPDSIYTNFFSHPLKPDSIYTNVFSQSPRPILSTQTFFRILRDPIPSTQTFSRFPWDRTVFTRTQTSSRNSSGPASYSTRALLPCNQAIKHSEPNPWQSLSSREALYLNFNNASYQMNLRKRFLKGGAVRRADLRIFFGMVVSMASCIMERV